MKEVTLIFPPVCHIDEMENEALPNALKLKAYNLWLSYIQKKFGPSSDLHKVLSSTTDAISLGLLSLCTYLKKRDVNVHYIHCDYWLNKKRLTWNNLLDVIAQKTNKSNVCGIYSTTPMINYALQIAQAIKLKNSETILVLGGPHVTFVDIETINQYPYIDFVVRGEGEETLYEIIKNSDQIAKSKMEIPGTTYRSHGIVKRATERVLLSAAEIPSPDFDILPKDYNILLIDMYSRGCHFGCNFCAESEIWKNRVRFRDPRIVAEELVHIKQNFKQDFIHIADSEIDVSLERLTELLDAIDDKKINCRYTVNLRPDAYKRLNSTVLTRMNDLGFLGFFVGVESGSDYMLNLMGRKSTFSDFLKTIDLLNQNKIQIIIPYLMLGFPGETENTLNETQNKFITLLEEERISFFFPKIFIPYPGTDPYKKPEMYCITISKKWEEYSRFGFSPPFSSSYLSDEILRTSIIRFYERMFTVLQRKL